MYEPKPIDTSNVTLPAKLLALTEQLAENVHDVWAMGRIAEGWTYGEVKDVEKKKTPQLIPYMELPEEKKREACVNIRNGLGYAKKVLSVAECDLLILDEVLVLVEPQGDGRNTDRQPLER